MVQPLLREKDAVAPIAGPLPINLSFNLPGVGTPVAAFFEFSEAGDTATIDGGGIGRGACTATTQFASYSCRKHNDAAGSVGFNQTVSDACIKILSSADGSVLAKAEFVSFTADNVNIRFIDIIPAAAYEIRCVLVVEAGGALADLRFLDNTSGGDIAVVTGMEPHLWILGTTFGLVNNLVVSDGHAIGFGHAGNDGGVITQSFVGEREANQSPTNSLNGTITNGINGNWPDAGGSKTSGSDIKLVTTTGYTYGQLPALGGTRGWVLAIHLVGGKGFVDPVSIPVTAIPTVHTPNFGYGFGGGSFCWAFTHDVGQKTLQSGSIAVGTSAVLAASGRSFNIHSEDNQTTSDTGTTNALGQVCRLFEPDGTTDQAPLASINTVLPTTYELNWIRVNFQSKRGLTWAVNDPPSFASTVLVPGVFAGAGAMFASLPTGVMPPINPKIDVWNLALIRLGGPCLVTVDDNVKEAAIIRCIWPQIRREFLNWHTWNGAHSFFELTDASAFLKPPVIWQNVYYLDDQSIIRVFRVNAPEGEPSGEPWAVSTLPQKIDLGLGAGLETFHRRVLFTRFRISGKSVQAIFDVGDDISSLSPIVRGAMAIYLAFKIAPSMGRSDMTPMLLEEWNRLLGEARSIDGQEGTPQHRISQPLVDARIGRFGFFRGRRIRFGVGT